MDFFLKAFPALLRSNTADILNNAPMLAVDLVQIMHQGIINGAGDGFSRVTEP